MLRFTHRATGEGHEKPWWMYFVWILDLGNSDTPIMWVLVLSGVGFLNGRTQVEIKFTGIFCLLLFLFFTAIPYKTPWLSMDILAPLLVLAGVGLLMVSIKYRTWERHLIAWILPLLAGGLIQDSWQKCYRAPNGERNFLAYSPTSYDASRLGQQVEKLAARRPGDFHVQVISEDYWPLPWSLRHVSQVGYWNEVPEQVNGDVIITSPKLLEAVQQKLGPGWNADFYGLRAEVLVILLTKKEL
jgi:predicted membrane-bound mannosyltransferase